MQYKCAPGGFPRSSKNCKSHTICKAENKKCVQNYRPISAVVSSSVKIVEKIDYIQINNYLISNNMLVSCQFGFRPKLSTENAMHHLCVYGAYSQRDMQFVSSCIMQKRSTQFITLFCFRNCNTTE